MKTQTVHFTLGENLGDVLTRISREKLLCEYDPSKAVSVITQALIGCPNDIALKIIKGDIVLYTAEDGETLNATEYDSSMTDKEILNYSDIANKWKSDIAFTADEMNKSIVSFIKETYTSKYYNIGIDYKKFVGSLYNDDDSFSFDDLDDSNDIDIFIEDTKSLFNSIKEFIEQSNKRINVIRWMHEHYPDEVALSTEYVPLELSTLILNVTDLSDSNINAIVKRMRIKNDYIEENIDVNEGNIEPVNILDLYDAGWLSPEGVFYGMDGSISDMLHLAIADKLYEQQIIPNDKKYESNPDYWLSRNGWVKIHNNHIMYDGYIYNEIYHTDYKLTDIQKELIYKYGQKRGGMLQFGSGYTFCSAAKFSMMDEFAIKKILN